ncbi:MAG: effector-associated constant component EACC1, partial [Pseudonocardiaceae bacterium]
MSSGNGDTDAGNVVNLLLVLEPDPELDPEAGERLTRQLRGELAELDIESIGPAADGTAPDGAKGIDPVTLGAVIVALSASGGIFTTVIETLRDWLGRHSRRHRISVTIDGDTIELERATAGQQRELVDAYVRRHSGR